MTAPKRAAVDPPLGPAALPGSVLPPDAPGTPPPAPSRAGGGTQDREHPHPAEVSLPGPALEPAVPGDLSLLPPSSVPRGAAAGIQAPAGAGSVAESSAVPAGSTPRTFTIALPAGLKLLSLNDRLHFGARYRRSQDLKKAACVMALKAKVPRLERVSVVVEYQPRDRRHRDPDNIAASAKALIDGLRAARVLPEDDSRHVAEVTCRIGETYPQGRLVLHLTEVAAAAGGEAA